MNTKNISLYFFALPGVIIVSVIGLSSASGQTWSPTSGGDWNAPANWGGNVPNVAGAAATISKNFSGIQNFNISSSAIVGLLSFGDTTSTYATLNLTGSASQTLTFDNNSSGATFTFNAGGAAATRTVSVSLILNDNITFAGDNATGGLTVNGAISETGTSRNLIFEPSNDTTTLVLGGSNTYTGSTTIKRGILSVSSLNSVSEGTGSSSLGVPTLATGTIALGSTGNDPATLRYTGTGETTDRVIRLASTTKGPTLDQSGATGVLKFTSDFTATGAGSKTLTLTGSTDGSGEIAGAIVNNSSSNKTSLSKKGSGTWTLSGTNTYTGTTAVTAGKLLIGSTMGSTASLASTSTVTVTNSGTTLGGQGTVGGATTITDGNLAPGASAGSLEFGGSLTLAGAAQTHIELGGTAFSLNTTEEYDRIKLTGTTPTLTVTGTLNISLISGFGLLANQAFGIFQLASGATRTGTFNGLATDGSRVGNYGGRDLFITYSANFGDNDAVAITGGNDIALYTVPEPNAAALLGGLGTLLLLRRRRSSHIDFRS